jgi:hypothetical protein
MGRMGDAANLGVTCRLEGSRFKSYPKICDILSGARKAESGVKQAAPGNYRTRCFAHRSVGRLFIRGLCQQT